MSDFGVFTYRSNVLSYQSISMETENNIHLNDTHVTSNSHKEFALSLSLSLFDIFQEKPISQNDQSYAIYGKTVQFFVK